MTADVSQLPRPLTTSPDDVAAAAAGTAGGTAEAVLRP